MKRVAARLQDGHHRDARHRYFGVVARRLDLNFFERVVVEIDGRILVGAHRDVHPLDLKLGLRGDAVARDVLP